MGFTATHFLRVLAIFPRLKGSAWCPIPMDFTATLFPMDLAILPPLKGNDRWDSTLFMETLSPKDLEILKLFKNSKKVAWKIAKNASRIHFCNEIRTGYACNCEICEKIFFSIFHYNEFQIFENGQKLTLQILEILCFKYSCCYWPNFLFSKQNCCSQSFRKIINYPPRTLDQRY